MPSEHQKRKQKFPRKKAWLMARKAVQYTFLVCFVALFIMSKRDGGWEGSLANLPMRLDPLLVLANILSSRTFLAGTMLALLTVALTILFGRAWCGWICPLGTTLDLITPNEKPGNHKSPSESLRVVKHILLISTITSAAFGSLNLLFFDPLTFFYRFLATTLWPFLDRMILWFEKLMFRIPFLAEPIAGVDNFLRPAVFPVTPAYFQGTLLFGFLFLVFIFLNFVSKRFWCRYLCPLGSLLGLISKTALFRRRVSEECSECALCSKSCPMGTINPAKGYASDPGECTMCLSCLDTCPRTTIAFSPQAPKVDWKEYDPDRRQFLLTAGITAAAVTLTQVGVESKREPSFLLRPPGARENNDDMLSMSRCVRCAACIRACPTCAIQPGLMEGGLAGFGSPILNMRMGYCDYSCNACGQICPVQAIPTLSLEEKRKQVIGKAYIDTDRCIAWADHKPCIVCEEMCPLPQKAIQLEEQEVWSPGGSYTKVKLPHVVRDACIGCGICEYKCPVNGDSAIRVYVPSAPIPF